MAFNPLEEPVLQILDWIRQKSKIEWGWSTTVFSKTQQPAKADRSLDRGVIRYVLVLILIAAGLFLLLTFIGVNVIDISLMIGSMLANR